MLAEFKVHVSSIMYSLILYYGIYHWLLSLKSCESVVVLNIMVIECVINHYIILGAKINKEVSIVISKWFMEMQLYSTNVIVSYLYI